MSSSALVLIAPGFEEIETTVPIDLLRRAGGIVTIASCSDAITVTGRSSIILTADCLLAELSDPFAFDMLILPGGPAVFDLRKRSDILNLIREFGTMGKLIGAICAAPLLLLDAGLINKESACTAHSSTVEEIPQLSQNESVVKDGQLITSRGAGTSLEFGLSLINCLFGPEKVSEIRSSIHADLSSPR
jgi:4-methyl-5(b-hydroxyethyl)-thiazole monophosphate biosynthesis